MEGFRTWSVGTDDGLVTASCPEPLRFPSGPLPEWMGRCAAAVRDALRELPITAGTLLEATLAGDPPPGSDFENLLLDNVGIPETHVHAGVRLRRIPAYGPGVIQTYRRMPAAVAEPEDDDALLAAVQVPIAGVYELDSASRVWLAVRRAAVAALPPAGTPPPGGIDVRVRLASGTERERGSVDLIKKVLLGVCASFHAYDGASLAEIARGLAAELRGDEAEMTALLSSPRGAVLGPSGFLSLRGERVLVHPVDDRIRTAEIAVTAGEPPQLEIQLRPAAALP